MYIYLYIYIYIYINIYIYIYKYTYTYTYNVFDIAGMGMSCQTLNIKEVSLSFNDALKVLYVDHLLFWVVGTDQSLQ